ncbi:MAG TPA: thioredoxin-like domain-containing protein [Puia sp.]|jgi:thioredoxin-related protein
MKKIFPALVILLISNSFVFAQQTTADESKAPYLRFPTIPPFNLLKVDSATYLTKDDIKKHHLTIMMFFSPECDHCKHQTRDILGAIDKFKDVEIVMATYQPFGEMREFYNNFHIADYPNIKVGRDEKFVLPPFYKMKSLPFLALYDKKGNLITTFEGNQKVDTLLNAFNKKEN